MTTRPTITPLPPTPSRQDPDTFSDKADTFISALPDFATDLDDLADYLEEIADDAALSTSADATSAATSASNASDSADAAAASELVAAGAANYQGDYDAGTLYAIGESVTYTGSQFTKKTTAVAGTTPVDGVDWLELGVTNLETASTSGSSQEISFAGSGIHNSSADVPVVTYTFANSVEAAKVDLIIDYQALTTLDMTAASYSGNSFSVSGQTSNPTGVAFNGDGTKMFVIGSSSDRVLEYTLSTGFDVTTASYSGNSFSVTAQAAAPTGVAFNGDGTKMFVIDSGNKTVFEYTLSTGFDVSTASYSGNSFSVSAQVISPQSVAFNTDGTKMFVIDAGFRIVFEYTLSTGFDVTTASYSGNSFSVSAQESAPQSVAFNTDGTKMFVIGSNQDKVFEYTLSTGFDVTTASYSGNSFSVSAQEANPASLAFNGDGTKMVVTGASNRTVFEYNSASAATLVFPTMEKPYIPLLPGKKTALSIVTSDTGTSYQVVNAQGGIV